MIRTTMPTCTGTAPLKNSFTCIYSYDESRTLTLVNILTTDVPPGTTLTFTISDFENPYSEAPKSGFTITTYDES